MTLDGVMQAPGGPEEDKSNGFAYGGWQYSYFDQVQGDFINGLMQQPFELLLGRKTYDIFAAYWPTAKTDNEVAVPFNKTKKYVVSHTHKDLSWHNSFLITGDVVSELKKLKALDAPDLHVWGSGNLIQTLLKNDVIDRMHILTYPLVIGSGKRLFEPGVKPQGFKLVDSKVSTTGTVIATYEPGGMFTVGKIGE